MKIIVSAEDIKVGKAKSSQYCPLALVIRRALPDAGIIRVFSDYLYISGTRVSLPRKARNFIILFDSGQNVEPFDFELELTPLGTSL